MSLKDLRRDLGTIESYAILIGTLIGAGIFKVTSYAWELTGPSVILAYLVLAPAILATSVAYSVFLSTPLGGQPGGEYTHLSRTFRGYGVAFVGIWVKLIAYVGALAFLSYTLGEYVAELFRLPKTTVMPIAFASLIFFYAIHAAGVRWFGRLQVAMCALLGVSIVVLVVPGLFFIRVENYKPFFTHGLGGFAAALPPLFFAYAGFESLAQTAGEVRDSTRSLPRVFLRGILATTVIYFLMSFVAFGVLPGEELRTAAAPMAAVASRYLPAGTSWFITFGAIMAITTSLNSTMLVPSRIGVMLAEDGLAPKWLGAISPRTGTPIHGLTITLIAGLLLLGSGRIGLALNIAVFALVVLYFLHSIALIYLPITNRPLYDSITLRMSRGTQLFAAVLSIISMGTLIVLLVRDVEMLKLLGFWAVVGGVLYWVARRKRV
ncbi:MAG TPA: amino acid permease [Thermoanaerobaculia bacterium]|nr:amino acid permease [Thermoanaerobaculia bacterium]